jgi:hypothetical protein
MPKELPSEAERRAFEEEGARLLLWLSRQGGAAGGAAQEALDLAVRMRDARALEELGRFADRARGLIPGSVLLRTLQAQALVDLRMAQAARDVLLASPAAPPADGLAWSEHQGLLGRVGKQIFVDAPDRGAEPAREALRDAIAAYRGVFEHDRSHYWHGINLAALLQRPEAAGLGPDAGAAAAAAVGREVVDALEAVPPGPRRDAWWQATLAEAQLALGDADAFEQALAALLRPISKAGSAAPREANAFALNSLRRQLSELWELDSARGPLGPRGAAVLDLLRGALLREPATQAAVSLDAAEVAAGPPPTDEVEALERNFGGFGVQTAQWWDLGRRRARSVAAIWGPDRGGRMRRLGSGFLLAVLPQEEDRPVACVLTNAHVIGGRPPGPVAIPNPTSARIRFEGAAADAGQREHRVAEILWSSPVGRHDATLLRLDPPVPEEIQPLPAASALPDPEGAAQLFVIGHPLGDELSFSFQDNRLLDHDGPPATAPLRPGVALLHYRTPTEPGSSGSPVFVEQRWRAVALHHAGTASMRRLNGKTGTYEANEGVGLASIAAALLAEKGHRLLLDEEPEE